MTMDVPKSGKVITIDGPAGAGKSTIARLVAQNIGFVYLDTGAIYRAISFYLSRMSIPPLENGILISQLAKCRISMRSGRVFLEGADVSDLLRSQEVDRVVSAYSALPVVRRFLMKIQREQARDSDIVADGRDMGSVVFPDAALKIFLDANLEVRAKRRWMEIRARDIEVPFVQIMSEIEERDRQDSEREISPLLVPSGAHIIDTSDLTIGSVVEEILGLISRANLLSGQF